MAIKVTIIPNGPLMVNGDLSELAISGSDGQPADIGGKDRIFLCRCGASANKPFCDGTHSKIGFEAA